MKFLFAAIILVLVAMPALAGMEHSPNDRGLRGGSVDRGTSERDHGRNAERSGTRSSEWSGKTHGDGRR